MLDLGSNRLLGPLPRIYVQGACLWQEMCLGFKPQDGVADYTSMEARLDGNHLPWWSLFGNSGLQVRDKSSGPTGTHIILTTFFTLCRRGLPPTTLGRATHSTAQQINTKTCVPVTSEFEDFKQDLTNPNPMNNCASCFRESFIVVKYDN